MHCFHWCFVLWVRNCVCKMFCFLSTESTCESHRGLSRCRRSCFRYTPSVSHTIVQTACGKSEANGYWSIAYKGSCDDAPFSSIAELLSYLTISPKVVEFFSTRIGLYSRLIYSWPPNFTFVDCDCVPNSNIVDASRNTISYIMI